MAPAGVFVPLRALALVKTYTYHIKYSTILIPGLYLTENKRILTLLKKNMKPAHSPSMNSTNLIWKCSSEKK